MNLRPDEAKHGLRFDLDAGVFDERGHRAPNTRLRRPSGRARLHVLRELADVRAEDEPERAWMLEREPHVADSDSDEPLAQVVAAARLAFRHARVERPKPLSGRCREERGLVAKVMVRRGLAHARRRRHSPQRHAFRPVSPHDAQGGGDERRAKITVVIRMARHLNDVRIPRMEAGSTVATGKGELFTCVRSAKDGGTFEFELEMAAGVEGPPAHSHPDPEHVEVTSGECVFWLDGKEHRLGAGDRLVIPPGVSHTFKIGKATMRARGVHGGRFERAVDQLAGEDGFTRMAMYLTYVDPQASYMKSPIVRAFLRVVAFTGKLRGIRSV